MLSVINMIQRSGRESMGLRKNFLTKDKAFFYNFVPRQITDVIGLFFEIIPCGFHSWAFSNTGHDGTEICQQVLGSPLPARI